MARSVLCVVGARPNFMKVAPLLRAFENRPSEFGAVLVHTGQHFDAAMSDVFFGQLGLPEPDIHLGVGSGSHAAQTAGVMAALEPVVAEVRPDLILVVGDVNSTVAAAMVAAKASLPLAHVEAGLRSFDRRMPEEINRVVTDALSTFLFATEDDAVVNLRREGIEDDRIFLVGNVMIDTLFALLPAIRDRAMPAELGLAPRSYGVVTLHRPANVDDPAALSGFAGALATIGPRLPLVFPAHPRTKARIEASGLGRRLEASNVRLVEPLPYVEFTSLVADARLVLTDSGGIQEETTVLGVPCLTLRDTTERPATVRLGTNVLVGTEPDAAVEAVERALDAPPAAHSVPPLWDGHAAERIAAVLAGVPWRAYETTERVAVPVGSNEAARAPRVA